MILENQIPPPNSHETQAGVRKWHLNGVVVLDIMTCLIGW